MLKEYMQYRCSMYYWLRNLYIIEPDAKVIQEIADSCKEFSDVLECPEHERKFIQFFACLTESEVKKLSKDIRCEYARLFIGPRRPLAPPYESCYRSHNKQLFGMTAIEVRRQYQIQGLQINTLGTEPDDFIGFEFEFMYYLSHRLVKALDENNQEEVTKLLKYQGDFISSHLIKWIESFTDDIYSNTEMEYFKVLSKFTQEFILEDNNFLNGIR